LFEVDRTLARLADEQNFVVKPAGGSGGDGILVLGERGPDGWSTPKGRPVGVMELRRHLANITFGSFSKQLEDHALIERRIRPHPLYDAFWPDGVCDLRVIVLRGQPILSMVRVPTRRSGGRANLHQGGIGVAVDVASGTTYRAVSQGRALEHHPESGERLVGRKLPHWDTCVDIARRCSSASPLGYLGVDLCVDAEAGPLVLELNVRPGLEIQNVCARRLGHALAVAGFEREPGANT
jgi:alpha-L-glutamate ligase-like protein